jgi:hypothetical protein
MSSQVIIFQKVPQAAVEAWGALGVHGLHGSIPRDAVSILKEKTFAVEQGAPGFVSLLIKSCDVDQQPLLDQTSFSHIRDSLTLGLRLEAEPIFSLQDQQKLLMLPVFMVRHYPGKRSTLGSASGTYILMRLPDDFPLPRLESDDVIYVDMGDFATERLIRLVNRNRPQVHNELNILQLAINHWDHQPMDVQDRFIEKVFESRPRISALREPLKSLDFVTVDGKDHRVPPCGLIHPKSQLAELYEGEPGRIPTGRFALPDYLAVMQSEGFLDISLTELIVEERLQYLSLAPSDKTPIARKATAFVKLLDKSWKLSYRHLILQRRSMEWFPYDNMALVAPDRCRDSNQDSHAHPYYYDLCFKVLNGVVVRAPQFRSALGWSDAIPSHILVEQLRLTLKEEMNSKDDRLITLLNYLGQLYSASRLANEVIEDLKEIVDGQLWIPVIANSTRSLNLATSKHAVLSEESKLASPFRQVDTQLKHHNFFLEMGCTKRYCLFKLYHGIMR